MEQVVTLEREVTFSSGHRYWLPSLSEEENRALFGPWASPYNHGHNYVLRVRTSGVMNPADGMVVNIKTIDDFLKNQIVAQFDQKSINDEVPFFRDRSPSLENLVRYIRSQMQGLPSEVKLEGLKLEETPTLYAEWHATYKEPKVTITRIYEFAASHRLHAPSLSNEENTALFGKCNNVAGHGHNYVLEVTVSGEPDPHTGMIVGLEALDQTVNQNIVDRYDHRNLNVDLPEFEGKNPTSEVVALQIFDTLKSVMPDLLVRVRLHETARSVFEVNAKVI